MALTFRKQRASKRAYGFADLRRETENLATDETTLAEAERAVEQAEAALGAVDPELDAEGWHRARADQDEQLRFAIRERDRLRAAVEHRLERCRLITDEVESVPVQDTELRLAERRARMQALSAELAERQQEQADDERLLADFKESRSLALRAFESQSDRAASARDDADLQRQAEWHVRQRAAGLNYPTAPAVERLIPAAYGRLAATAGATDGFPNEGARAAGVTRVGAGSSKLS